MTELSERDLALLHAKFVIPLVVSRMLRGEEAFDEIADYTLNGVMGELEPDTALLCIALCSQHIGIFLLNEAGPANAVGRMLKAEADRVVADYGSLWLANDRDPASVSAMDIRALLPFIPEDLEAMAHLLDATLAQLDGRGGALPELCDLLAVQAHEHMSHAESELFAADLKPQRRGPERRKTPRAPAAALQSLAAAAPEYGGNVIPFPRRS